MCRRQGGQEAREVVEIMERRKVDIACVAGDKVVGRRERL